MIRTIAVLSFLLITAGALLRLPGAAQPPASKKVGPTVELLTQDRVEDGTSADWIVARFHDKSSGVEFICVYHSGCVLTGRSWK